MSAVEENLMERALLLAPRGRDAAIAKTILAEAHIAAVVCADLGDLLSSAREGAEVAIVTEEALRCDTRELAAWVSSQPTWSDFPFIVLTEHGGGIERNPEAVKLMATLGNVSFLERPFHPTTLISLVQTNLRGRRRQYECRRLNDDLEARVRERTSELAQANDKLVAQILERERVEMTLRKMQRLEAVGQLTSGVAHDFNNLLTVVLGNINFLERALDKAQIDGKTMLRLGYMRIAAERGAKLTDQLLSFSRRQRLEPRIINLNDAVRGLRDLLQSTLGGSFHVMINLAEDLWAAVVDPTQLDVAILNLAINARDAMQIGGTLQVATRNVILSAPVAPEEPPRGEYVCICVSDSGCGMQPEIRDRVFEPFFTTKEVGKGSGLGLSQVLGFAQQSNGGLHIDSEPGRGTSVHIYLPRAQQLPIVVEAPRETNTPGQSSRASILLVDDDDAVRDVTAAMLRDCGYWVEEVSGGAAALAQFAAGRNYELVIIDYAMPGMSGAELARHLRQDRPALPIMFVTGYADRDALSSIDGPFIVRKPYVTSELANKVKLALSGAVARPAVDLDLPANAAPQL